MEESGESDEPGELEVPAELIKADEPEAEEVDELGEVDGPEKEESPTLIPGFNKAASSSLSNVETEESMTSKDRAAFSARN